MSKIFGESINLFCDHRLYGKLQFSLYSMQMQYGPLNTLFIACTLSVQQLVFPIFNKMRSIIDIFLIKTLSIGTHGDELLFSSNSSGIYDQLRLTGAGMWKWASAFTPTRIPYARAYLYARQQTAGCRKQ